MIGIIDYGMGNLFSVSQALERLQVDYFISEKESELSKADALILPGVGAFKDAMARLNETGLSDYDPRLCWDRKTTSWNLFGDAAIV